MNSPADKNARQKFHEIELMLTKLFALQAALIADFRIIMPDHTINKGAVGYIYGFMDCATQVAKAEINCGDGHELITNIFDFLQNDCGIYVREWLSRSENQDREFMAGVMHGGTEYNNWVKLEGRFLPVGLGRYFYHRPPSDA